MEYKTLSNGVKMPMLGYGVFQVANDVTEQCVCDALSVGYRSIDTAQAYANEEGVGAAIAKSGIPRDELFITSKIWISNAGDEKAAKSIDESLKKLGLDYIDLMLIHQPIGDYYGSYRAMESAYKAGKLRAIGVSNFGADRVVDLCNFVEVAPMVDQIETHVFKQQAKTHETLEKYHVAHEAWAPFAEGRNDMFTNPVLVAVGAKYGKSAAQVALRFLIQSDVIVIPKSTHIERMEQNFDVFDFTLDATDMDAIQALNEEQTQFFDHADPASVQMLADMGKKSAE